MVRQEILHLEKRDGYMIGRLPRTISMYNYIQVENDIAEALSGEEDRLVLDLGNMDSIYSSAIGLIIRLRKRVAEGGGSICLVNVSAGCRRTLDSVHLSNIVPTYSTDVEFEVLHEEIWEKKAAGLSQKFLCVHHMEDGVARVTVSGHMMSHADLSTFEDPFHKDLVECYVFDLTGLDAIDSHGAQLLSEILTTLKSSGAKSVAYGANTTVSDLLAYLSLTDYLPCYEDEREALAAIGKA